VEARMSKLSWFIAGAVTALTAAAISKEMEKPVAERAWKGTIAGIPYNLNIPSWPDIAREYWNPESDQILSPHAIGIGWGVNLAALWRWIEATLGEPRASAMERSGLMEREPRYGDSR
jgi:hypothetical protein